MNQWTKRYISLLLTIIFSCSILTYYKVLKRDAYLKNLTIAQLNIMAYLQGSRPTNVTRSVRLPKVIYMLWDTGFENAPSLQKSCLESFQRHNPDFKMRPLNLTEAELLIDRRKYYSDDAWSQATVQAKSDIIRVEILANSGGVWADASVYCNEPLSGWLNDTLLSQGFLAYERRDGSVNSGNSPWIASWFMAATVNSPLVKAWRAEVRQAWAKPQTPAVTFGYFWVHRIFRNMVKTNKTLGDAFEKTPRFDAGGPHCILTQIPTPHVYKLKAYSCEKIRMSILGE